MLQNPVQLDATLAAILQVCSGLFWTITYLLILRRGYRDKAYGMPMVALCANVSWEFIFSFVYPHPQPQLYIDYLWLLFDVGILVQYLLYGRREYPAHLPPTLFYGTFLFALAFSFLTIVAMANEFYGTFLFALAFSFLTIVAMAHEFDDFIGIYAAFAQNLLMSALFIGLLLKRNSAQGQSVYIALSKMVGTLFPSFLFYLYFPQSYLLMLLYAGIFVLDLWYFLLLYFKIKEVGKNPWKWV